jgi:hypothetical protein
MADALLKSHVTFAGNVQAISATFVPANLQADTGLRFHEATKLPQFEETVRSILAVPKGAIDASIEAEKLQRNTK